MISRAALVPVQGRASCPSTNNVRPIFKAVVVFSNRWCLPKRLGHFLWKGIKPFPALGTLFAKAAQGIQVLAILAAWREKISRE